MQIVEFFETDKEKEGIFLAKVAVRKCPYDHGSYHGTPEIFIRLFEDGLQYCVECRGCNCHGPLGETPREAVNYWNKRDELAIFDT